MRIGLISPPWISVPPTAYGGTESVIDRLACGLVSAGHEVLLAAAANSTCPVERVPGTRDAVDGGPAVGGAAGELGHVVVSYAAMADVDLIHDHTTCGPMYHHHPALTMDKAAARAGVGKATVYRRWPSRAELAAEALGHAGLTDNVAPIAIGTGHVRDELLATLLNVAGDEASTRVDLISALHDTARQEPELCSLIRRRYVASLRHALTGVLDHAISRGDLPTQQPRGPGQRNMAVSAAIALLVYWGTIHDRPINDNDIEQIVDGVLMPLL